MNTPLALAVLLAATPALSGTLFITQAPAGPVSPAAYAAAAHTAGVSVAKTQFAIIHALAGYESPNLAGYPDFESWKMRDEVLLRSIEEKAKVRIEVTPLAPAQRAVLWEEARVVRSQHRNGAHSRGAAPQKPLSLEQLERKHAAIIARYAANVKVLPAGDSPRVSAQERLPFTEQSYAERNRLYSNLRVAVEHLAAAGDEQAFKTAVDRFNAVAAPYQEGVRLEWKPGDGAQAAAAALRAAQDYERKQLAKLDEIGEYLGHPSLFAALEPVKATGAFFDGTRGAAPSPVRQGSFPDARIAEHVPGASQAAAPLKAPVPNPEKDEKKAEKPGLLGMLGSLLGKFFTGLFRTVMRVGAAVLKSAGLIAKALFS